MNKHSYYTTLWLAFPSLIIRIMMYQPSDREVQHNTYRPLRTLLYADASPFSKTTPSAVF